MGAGYTWPFTIIFLEMKARKWKVGEVDTTSTNGPENRTNHGENTWEKGHSALQGIFKEKYLSIIVRDVKKYQ